MLKTHLESLKIRIRQNRWANELRQYQKGLSEWLRYPFRQRQLQQTLKFISKQQLIEDLRELGIVAGDVVLVHSSLKSLGYVEDGAKGVIEALIAATSPGGTIAIPTYHMIGGSMYNTCRDKNYIFDPRRCGTFLGKIPSAFLGFPSTRRSLHPTHSVSALGAQASFIVEAHHRAPSACGPDSPWDRLLELNAKALGLGVSMAPFAFYHYLEDQVIAEFPLPVHLPNTYSVKCRDWDGALIEVPVRPLDPRYVKHRIDQPHREDLREYFFKEFTQAGLLTIGQVGEARAWFIFAQPFHDHLLKLMREGITIYASAEVLESRPLS